MNKIVIILCLSMCFCCGNMIAQETQKSDLEKRAEAVDPNTNIATARSLYIHAFNDYANKGQIRQGVECAIKATPLYYKENYYQEAFDLLRRIDESQHQPADIFSFPPFRRPRPDRTAALKSRSSGRRRNGADSCPLFCPDRRLLRLRGSVRSLLVGKLDNTHLCIAAQAFPVFADRILIEFFFNFPDTDDLDIHHIVKKWSAWKTIRSEK